MQTPSATDSESMARALGAQRASLRERLIAAARRFGEGLRRLRARLDRRFWIVTVACVLGYVALQVAYVLRIPLVMDELDGAFDVRRLLRQTPYVDFQPYKTVLGYYLQLPFLATAPDVWTGVMRTKLAMAGINAASMIAVGALCARTYSRSAAALAMPLWMLMTNWVDRSSELRVDTLTALAGAFSLMALLRGRMALSGALCALSFLMSQKGLYYAVASAAALGTLVLPARHRPRALRDAFTFGVPYLLVLGVYFGWFALQSSLSATLSSTVTARAAIVFDELYGTIDKYWAQSLRRNVAFYVFAGVGLLVLAIRLRARRVSKRNDARVVRDVRLLVYGGVLLVLCVWHKQPWPYFFVLLVPTAYVLQVVALQHLLAMTPRMLQATRRPEPVLGVLGVCLWAFGAGVVHPGYHFGKLMLRHDSSYQREMIETAERLVGPKDTYLAGTDVLYDRQQPVVELRRLSRPRRKALLQADSKQVAAMMLQLRAAPPKLLIANERFEMVPEPIVKFLSSTYAPFYGSLELYAPSFAKGKTRLQLAHAGRYRVKAEADRKHVRINGKALPKNGLVTLKKGVLRVESRKPGRLQLQAPEIAKLRLPEHMQVREFNGEPYKR